MEFKHNDILIIGDSFCQSRHTPEHWPYILHKTLTGIKSSVMPRGFGYGGCSWWSVRQQLLKDVSICKPKILILCHTECNRLPSDLNIGISATSVERGVLIPTNIPVDDDQRQRLIQAGKLYYQELWVEEYHEWAQLAWFRELDQLVAAWDIPFVVHLHCFVNNYTFKNGYTHPTSLFALAKGDQQAGFNHFTLEENQYLSDMLANVIRNMMGNIQ